MRKRHYSRGYQPKPNAGDSEAQINGVPLQLMDSVPRPFVKSVPDLFGLSEIRTRTYGFTSRGRVRDAFVFGVADDSIDKIHRSGCMARISEAWRCCA